MDEYKEEDLGGYTKITWPKREIYLKKPKKGRVKNWAKKARAKGYRVERDDVLVHRNNFVFAFRIPSKQQVGELRCLDVVVCKNPPEFHQCKYNKKYFHKEEKERLLALASKYNCLPVLCHRELGKGLKFEFLS